jgi:hypothetical protein
MDKIMKFPAFFFFPARPLLRSPSLADPKRKKRVNRETVTTVTQKNQEPVVWPTKNQKVA